MHQCIVQLLKYTFWLQGKNKSRHMLLSTRNWVRPRSHELLLLWNQKSLRSTCSEIIGETDLILEDGMDIQELPIIVRKIRENQIPEPPKKFDKKICDSKNFLPPDQEVKEMIEGFDNCYSPRSVFTLLELIPPSEITPAVALQALKTIIKFENSQEFRSQYGAFVDEDESEFQINHVVINNLIDTIIKTDDNSELLEALQLIGKELPEENLPLLRQKLSDEVLIRIADGKFSISEICNSARSLLMSGNQVDVDKLWVGLLEKRNEINETNIMDVFRILLHVNLSRALLLKILQKQLEISSLKLSSENVAEVLNILCEIIEFPVSIIQCLSNWLNINILKIKEEDLGAIIESFLDLPFYEEDVLKAIEKFVMVQKTNIKNPELMRSIMDYCNKFKIRSEPIFTVCSEYVVQQAKYMSPLVLKSVFLPFGNLNFYPSNGEKFWKVLEEELMKKFSQFYSEDALDILLSFVFLKKHPIRFITKIFNPYFLDRLHSLKDSQQIQIIRTKLKLLDTALTIECNNYHGPLLLPDWSSSLISQDSRIQKISDHLLEILPKILEPVKTVAGSVILKNLPLTELYVVDIIIHPKGKPSLLYETDSWNDFTGLLIHLPEHYDSSGQYLIGSQIMRQRHLRCIGLNVVHLNYNIINSLLNNECELKIYLKNQLSVAEPAFPS